MTLRTSLTLSPVKDRLQVKKKGSFCPGWFRDCAQDGEKYFAAGEECAQNSEEYFVLDRDCAPLVEDGFKDHRARDEDCVPADEDLWVRARISMTRSHLRGMSAPGSGSCCGW